MSNASSQFNYTKWGFIVGTSIALITIVVSVFVPEVRCSVGFKSEACGEQMKTVELITQTELGERLGGVRVQVNSLGAPETQWTDENGYAKAKIPSKGDVVVNLSKEGYPTQNFVINLENEQITNKTIRLKKLEIRK
ncbi:hypothetical protein [Nostoc sp.]|uniref:hypothetical protein n=1 Tax=Nostoc sp. TaxID=1180 RepID=UPI002FFA1A1C